MFDHVLCGYVLFAWVLNLYWRQRRGLATECTHRCVRSSNLRSSNFKSKSQKKKTKKKRTDSGASPKHLQKRSCWSPGRGSSDGADSFPTCPGKGVLFHSRFSPIQFSAFWSNGLASSVFIFAPILLRFFIIGSAEALPILCVRYFR